MAQSLEYTHLYKFWVSLGVGCYVAAVVIPWGLLQLPVDVFLITRDQMSGLTHIGSDALRSRMRILAFAQEWCWVVSVGLIAMGSWLLSKGLPHWSKRQTVQDHREDLEREILEPDEKAARDQKEYAEALSDKVADSVLVDDPGEIDESAIALSAASMGQIVIVPKQDEVPSSRLASWDYVPRDAFLKELLVVERVLADAVRSGFKETHTVSSEMKLSLGEEDTNAVVVDLLVEGSRPDEPNYVVDVKLILTKNLASRLREAAFRIAEAASIVRQGTGRPTVGVLILVLNEADSRPREYLSRRLREVRSVLSEPVAVIILPRAELNEMTAASLRDRIEVEALRARSRVPAN